MSALSIPQQLEFLQLAAIGVLPFDALIVVGIPPAEADKLCSDTEILSLHRKGRSEGAAKVRKALIKAGERGSVSALRSLGLHREDDEIQNEYYPHRPAAKPVRVDVLASVDAAFARQRALHEGREPEIEIVEFQKGQADE